MERQPRVAGGLQRRDLDAFARLTVDDSLARLDDGIFMSKAGLLKRL